MEEYSILVGKLYRTPAGEVREVRAMAGGEVEYVVVPDANDPDAIAHGPTQRVPLAQFATEVESEVLPT